MTIWKGRSKRKASGGKYRQLRKKRKYELGPDASPTVASEKDEKRKQIKRRGGSQRTKLVRAKFANLSDGDKTKKVKILDVLENKANRHFVRRNIVTKGTVIKTQGGDAVVTSRPAQDGIVNARKV